MTGPYTQPELDLDLPGAPEKFAKPRAVTVRPNGYAKCPGCRQTVGYVEMGEHAYWKIHLTRTRKGTAWQCGVSAQALCAQLPVPLPSDRHRTICPCGGAS